MPLTLREKQFCSGFLNVLMGGWIWNKQDCHFHVTSFFGVCLTLLYRLSLLLLPSSHTLFSVLQPPKLAS
jgi:hypothetical protein